MRRYAEEAVESPMCDYELDYIEEPKLRFGHGQEAENPKDGLFLFGPVEDRSNPAEMRVGVVGTRKGLGHYGGWVSSIQRYIPPKVIGRGHHAGWPGFRAVYDSRWPVAPLVSLIVEDKAAHDTIRLADPHEAIYKTVSLFADPIRKHLRESETHPSIWFLVIPEELYRYGRPQSSVPKAERVAGSQHLNYETGRKILSQGSLFSEDAEAAQLYRYERNFHHQIKARLLDTRAVVQIVRETTLAPRPEKPTGGRALEDPATVAWNLCTTAFFKASGRPWKQARVRPGVCYVGLVFKLDETNPGSGNACCGAQMFLDSGDGLVFRGAVGPWYSEARKEFHLSREKAADLMSLVLDSYKDNHGAAPTELFIHGRKRFENAEWEGFQSVVPDGTNLVGVRIAPSREIKLYTPRDMPVLRGMALRVSDRRGLLFTKGFIPRLRTYPGWEVPNPLVVEVHKGDADLLTVMEDVMCLTKVNFNACVFADGLPVTLKFADAVGEILTAAPVDDLPPLPFRHYI